VGRIFHQLVHIFNLATKYFNNMVEVPQRFQPSPVINDRSLSLLAVVSELRRNHCEQTNDLLSSMREDHVMGSRYCNLTSFPVVCYL
jgi:hypothetical protein